MSLSAHKMYGPKGVGALWVRRKPRVRIDPMIDGGGHERGMRSGTLAVPLIVGFGKAAELAKDEMADEAIRLRALRDRLYRGITSKLTETYVNGSMEHRRLPGNLNISFAFVEGESLLMALKDVAVSSGSACTSASLEPSYVLRALGVGDELAHTSIRFGIGRFNTEDEIDYVDRSRRRSPSSGCARCRRSGRCTRTASTSRPSSGPRTEKRIAMAYSEKVIEHYENPRNVGTFAKDEDDVGTGLVGAPACGDVMRLQIKVKDGGIEDAKFKTFGCGSAIASSSLATEMIKGMTLDQAAQIKNTQIVEELNLPPVKIHCSVLAEDAIKAAIEDYKKKHA